MVAERTPDGLVHLELALETVEDADASFHIRQALQLLEADAAGSPGGE